MHHKIATKQNKYTVNNRTHLTRVNNVRESEWNNRNEADEIVKTRSETIANKIIMNL
jgi:hypothetical protein